MRLALVLPLLVVAPHAWGDQCDFIARAGGLVSMRSGTCTGATGANDRKSGRERCVDGQGRALSELSFEVGKLEAAGFYTDYNDQRFEGTFRGGVANGPMRVFSRDGKLLCAVTFKAGKAEGPVRELYPSGKLKEAWLFVGGKEAGPRLSLFENGKVKDLTCAPKSFVPEDKALCGYGGKAVDVELYNSPTERRAFTPTWKDGVLVATVQDRQEGRETRRYTSPDDFVSELRDEKGTVRRRYTQRAGELDGAYTIYTEAGQSRAEVRFEKGVAVSARRHYLNGRLEWTVETVEGHLLLKDYDDLGTQTREGSFLEGRPRLDHDDVTWRPFTEDGPQRTWRADKTLRSVSHWKDGGREGVWQELFRSGKVAVERRYEKDKLVRLECFSPQGEREVLEEYFADGSRKTADPQLDEKRAKGACSAER